MTVTSGRRCAELYRKSGPLGCLVRMCLESSIWRSTRCLLTWKVKATPAKRLLFQLAASTPHTNAQESQLWRTPGAEDAAGRGTYATYESYKKGRLEKGKQISLSNQVKFSQMFPTPTRFDATCGDLDGREYNGQTRHAMKLIQAAKMWPTPKARDFKDTTTLPPSRQKDEGKDSLSNRERNVKQWWPTEPDVGRGFDGLSAILDGIGGLSDAAKNRACEILCDVRESFTPEAVQRAFGGFQGISAEEILLAFLCEYEESCFRSGTTETSGAAPEGLLRGLWRTVESARASYRREYHSQLAREYSDALLRLSHGAPSLMPQAWANGTWEDGIERVTHGIKSRVDRLKCLGNAVVPQQFYPFFKYIVEIERKS